MGPTFFEDGNDVLSYNLHMMGGIFKEGWLWDFLIKFSFGCLQNFTPGTFVWMIEYSSHCAVIVADDDINDEKRLYNASSTIFSIVEASIIFEIP